MVDSNTVQSIVTIGAVFVGFVGNALYLRGSFGARITNNEKSIKAMKDTVQWKDTCDGLIEGVKDRVKSLETVRNGGG